MWIYLWMLLDWCGLHAEPPHPEIPAVVEEYFGEETSRALGVFWCESLHNPRAVSRTDDHGLTQISQEYWSDVYDHIWDQRYDITINVKMSHQIWTWGEYKFEDGWLLWTCGRY